MVLFGTFVLFLLIVVKVWIFGGFVYAVIGLMIGGAQRGVTHLHDYFEKWPDKLFR